MILLGSGLTAVRGTQPPDVLVPAFCVQASAADSRTAMTTAPAILRILIDAPPRPFGLGPCALPGTPVPSSSTVRSALGQRAHEGHDVADVVVAELRAPGGHGGVLAD